MMKSDELRGERYKLVKEARAILDGAEKENRDLTAEEREKYDRIEKDIDGYGDKIDEQVQAEERRRKMDDFEEPDFFRARTDEARESREQVAVDRAFRSYLAATESHEAVNAFNEVRALQADSDKAGGYTVVPQQFIAEMIEGARNRTLVRGLARTFSVPNAQSLGAPALDNRPADPTWTGEILTGDEDSTMTTGKRELYPHPLAQRIKLSKKLIRASALNIEQIVRDQLGYKFAVVEENAFLNGSGANEPLGVFTASSKGITTGQDVSTSNTTTTITADGLIEAKYNLHPAYWNMGRWIFHRDAVKQIRKLKDGEGQYLWRPGLQGDRGDSILDMPVLMSEYAPNTFTTGQYVGIVGDFSYYWIADALDMTIQVLTELYAATNQNGYIGRKETDGMPVLEEAFVRVTLA